MKVWSSFLLSILLLLLQGCGRPVNIDEIKEGFLQNKDTFEQLSLMIKKDTQFEACFTVGTDHIGDFWEYGNKWNTLQNPRRKVAFEVVLNEVGISSDRYGEYIAQLKIVGSERVSYCSNIPSLTSIMVYRSGFSISGCMTTVNIYGDGSMPVTDITPRFSTEITPLEEGWYIEHFCG
ncbi:hypothetical protein CMT41_16525 [Colwellia sp. MT41]|uniref:hypothetical protein n=1 Tax=Colwellia sp. MT41 TaxID=58049 RepID=UPI000717AE63|nr:hypothetical protein [Colwellia sp. MT41]ALO36156.1 hypothetical protein CMT41_16525 [Colwellia sp. MT41]